MLILMVHNNFSGKLNYRGSSSEDYTVSSNNVESFREKKNRMKTTLTFIITYQCIQKLLSSSHPRFLVQAWLKKKKPLLHIK